MGITKGSELHLIFIGAPGSGKGTQALNLKNQFGYKHISTGDLLREEVAKKSDLGLKIKSLIDSGSLVDDETVLELFKSNLELDSFNYILDGFPRTLKQCEMLDESVLTKNSYLAIYFKVDEDQVVSRIINRRIAPKSGKIYNLLTDPPVNEGVCDISGEALVHRDDDKEQVVRNRLEIYNSGIESILSYYNGLGCLKVIDASLSPGEVFHKLQEILKVN